MEYQEYCLRIDVPPNFDEDTLVGWFEGLPDVSGYAMFEFADWAKEENPHVHAYVRTTMTSKNLRNKLVRATWRAGTGNGSYSLKICDPSKRDQYAAYCCKGSAKDEVPCIVWLSGWIYQECWVHQMHKQYWDTNVKLRSIPKSGSLVTRLLALAKEQRVPWSDKTRLAELFIEMQIANHKPINVFSAKAVCQTVSCLLCPDGAGVKELAVAIFPPDIPYNFQ